MFLIQTQKKRKILITYYKTYGITTLKKHVDSIIVKKIDKKVNGLIKRTFLKQPTKKRLNAILFFLLSKIPLKRMMNNKKIFCKALAF